VVGGRSPGSRAYPPRLPEPPKGRISGCTELRTTGGIPGHSGGSAPDLHRLPFATDRMDLPILQRPHEIGDRLPLPAAPTLDAGRHAGQRADAPATREPLSLVADGGEVAIEIGERCALGCVEQRAVDQQAASVV
jgi:hypothetical protein